MRAELPYMPGYGVDAATWEPLPWSWAAERLAASRGFWVVNQLCDLVQVRSTPAGSAVRLHMVVDSSW